jgi:hypothetical protein
MEGNLGYLRSLMKSILPSQQESQHTHGGFPNIPSFTNIMKDTHDYFNQPEN